MEKIVLGLPKGSLNNVNRGNTHKLLVDAGYEVKGYEPGNEDYVNKRSQRSGDKSLPNQATECASGAQP